MKLPADIFEDTATAYADKIDGDLQKMKALFQLMNNNALVSLGSSVASLALSLHLPVSPLFKWTVYGHFCGGETFDECKITIQHLQKSNVGVLLNYGVELKEAEEDFDKTVAKNIEALEFKADWLKEGRAAGPIRNKKMLVEGKPDLVVAFHNDIDASKGTKNMLKQAQKAGIATRLFTEEGEVE